MQSPKAAEQHWGEQKIKCVGENEVLELAAPSWAHSRLEEASVKAHPHLLAVLMQRAGKVISSRVRAVIGQAMGNIKAGVGRGVRGVLQSFNLLITSF